MPNLANIPAVKLTAQALGMPELLEAAAGLYLLYNATLAGALADPQCAINDIDIRIFDIFGLFETVVQDPEAAGFSNATDPCIPPDVIVDAICETPREYVFWDGIHGTTSLYRFLAGQVREFITTGP